VLSSNGKVDAAGEHTLAKKNLPPVVHVIKRALAEAVAAEISSVAMEDVSGQLFMHRTAAVEPQRRIIPRRDRLQGMGSLPRRALVALPAASAAG
jgi:hypothetical protein